MAKPHHTHRDNLAQLAAEKKAKAEALAAFAVASDCDVQRKALSDVSDMLLRDVKSIEKGLNEKVYTLDTLATEKEVFDAQSKQAVRVGSRVYLPRWRDNHVALPACFIRSSLFPGTDNPAMPGDRWAGRIVHAKKDKTPLVMCYEGEFLRSFDRRVFAACVLLYRDEPLSSAEGKWISASFHKLAQSVGTTAGSGTNSRVKESLERLSSAGLTVRTGSVYCRLNPIVKFEAMDAASRKIRIRLTEDLAKLYGVEDWRSIPISTVAMNGLTGWLASFYSSHTKSAWIPISFLHEMSRLNSRPNDFERLLRRSLTELQGEDIPIEARVKAFPITTVHNKSCIRVITYAMNEGDSSR